MTIFKKNNEKKTTQKLPMTGKVKKGFRASLIWTKSAEMHTQNQRFS